MNAAVHNSTVFDGSRASQANTVQSEVMEGNSKKLSDFWKDAEFNRYAISSMMLILMGCIGGAAAAQAIDTENTFMLSMISGTTMLVEVMILSLSSMRVVLLTCLIAALVDLFAFAL